MTLKRLSSIDFPAVTVCPVAPVNCHRLNERIIACETNTSSCSPDTLNSLCSIYRLGDCQAAVRSGLQINRDPSVKDANCSAVDTDTTLGFLDDLDPNTALDFGGAIFSDFLWRLSHEDRIAIAARSEYSRAGCLFRGNREDPICQDTNVLRVVSTSVGICFSYNYFPPGEEGAPWRAQVISNPFVSTKN